MLLFFFCLEEWVTKRKKKVKYGCVCLGREKVSGKKVNPFFPFKLCLCVCVLPCCSNELYVSCHFYSSFSLYLAYLTTHHIIRLRDLGGCYIEFRFQRILKYFFFKTKEFWGIESRFLYNVKKICGIQLRFFF
jgi:hypothetical protein